MFKRLILIFFLYASFGVQSQEVSFGGFKMTHPLDFSEMLVGAAHLELSSIESVGGGILRITGTDFGFTGITASTPNTTSTWYIFNPTYTIANGLVGTKMGLFFAPTSEGNKETNYMDARPNVMSAEKIIGSGKYVPGAVQLNIIPSVSPTKCDNDNICTISLPVGGSVSFTVTPRINLPTGMKTELHQHVRFHLNEAEYDTNCFTFAEVLPYRKLDNKADYLDYILNDAYRTPRGKCTQNLVERSFTASIDKPLEFKSINQKIATGTGYVEYVFHAEGHYNVATEKCVDNTGCKIYRVSANGNTPPVTTNQPPTASFKAIPASVVVGTPVALASTSEDSDGTIVTYKWSSTPSVQIGEGQTSSVTFSQPEQYTVTLTVIDDKGASSTSLPQSINVTSNTTPSELFTLTTNANPTEGGSISGIPTGTISKNTQINLTATPSARFEFVSWNKNCNGVETKQNPLTITIANPTTTCTANFKLAQTQPTNLEACFNVQKIDQQSNDLKLDASCTKDGISFEWVIYSVDSIAMTLSDKQPQPFSLEPGKYAIVLIASFAGDKRQVTSKSIVISSAGELKEFANDLVLAISTSSTKAFLTLDTQNSKYPYGVDSKLLKYTWFSKKLSKKLGGDIGNITLEVNLVNVVPDVITLIASNSDDTYICSVTQIVTPVSASKPEPEIKGIAPIPSAIKSNLDEQALVFKLDGSTSKDPDNTPDPTKGIKQYKWKWEVSSNSGDLPADKSSSESPPFSIKDVFLGESQQFKFTLKVVDDEGQESDSGVSRIIAIKKPSAKFTATRLVEVGKEFILNATEPTPSEYKLDGTILSTDSNLNYRWIITDNQGTDVSSSVLQDNSNPTRPKMKITSEGVYTLILAVMDNYGLYQKTQPVELRVENPSALVNLDKGTLTKITSTGTPTGVDDGVVSFESGISIKDNQQYGNFLLNQKVAVGTEFKLRARISSNSLDKQVVDLLLVVGIEPVAPFDGGIDTVYYSYDGTGNLVLGSDKKPLVHNLYGKDPKIDWIPQLTTVPFANKVILTSAGLNLGLDGMFVSSGKYYFFIGYVQSDGTIVYSKSPIEVMVE